MNIQNFCWSWFKQSGSPAAYMEYLQVEQAPSQHTGLNPTSVTSQTHDHF
ncbi:MAG: hypothetical protein FWD03_08505 [Defluviitaleaceae bacterium]|nr:hypothetical protein [Defluviitaleaceae bacterium]